ncbi:protein FAR1-RELATED SEQUENCE 1 isoform X2 [Cajanus cajan]|uniref:protein FAR1-RELATED SEQUENCE 1 isoform X2 n=1 Tax=Cajanus cajan TaxID=3821 RepID=UPI00098D97EB|nr:protein FAR1-RELATED SEQUENCE 1 isoform X2 [Cajanus cajan]
MEPEPEAWPEFNSKDEAFSYYQAHAKSVGFSAIIKASRRSRISGNFIDAKFACTRYGIAPTPSNPHKPKRARTNPPGPKTDCKACMHVKRTHHGTWIISSFIKHHNHQTSPHHNNNTDNNASPSRKPKTKRTLHHLGDLQFLLNTLMCMQDENPNFFYAVDFDEEQRLRTVFWVDAKARLDYSHFNDVILLDTTHVKNDYKLPFVPFVGVNHHSQFLLLGLAFVCHESESTFVWLIRTWLRAMGGCAPKVMLTDRDQALKKAVSQVIPDACHCFCLWHVLSKVPEKLGRVVIRHGEFMSRFNKCVLRSRTKEQFEKRWGKMVERFELGGESWLWDIYEDREQWMPVFMKGRSLAGMSTVQRSEAMNCLFDKYVQRRTTLKEFLEQYRVVLRVKCEEEAKADFETLHRQPVLKSPSPFGKQMVGFYTHAVFKKFQSQVLGAVACHPRKESEEGPVKMFSVQDFEENQDFVVMWNELTLEASCSCFSFEFNGFLCRHVMIVLQISGVHGIPPRYILKRWTKDAKRRQIARDVSDVVVSDSKDKRYNNLCQRAFALGHEGSFSQESYIAAVNALEEALRKCESLNDSIQSVGEPNLPCFGSQEVNLSNNAGHTNKKDSTLRESQVCPEPEIIAMGVDSSWQQVGNPTTRSAGFDCSFESQQSIRELGQLNSRAQNLNGYFATQRIESGMYQLNSIATICRDNYSNQHGIQGLGQLNSITPIHDPHYMAPQRMNGMARNSYISLSDNQ